MITTTKENLEGRVHTWFESTAYRIATRPREAKEYVDCKPQRYTDEELLVLCAAKLLTQMEDEIFVIQPKRGIFKHRGFNKTLREASEDMMDIWRKSKTIPSWALHYGENDMRILAERLWKWNKAAKASRGQILLS